MQVLKTENLERNHNCRAVPSSPRSIRTLAPFEADDSPAGEEQSATSSSSATSASQYPTAVRETSGIKISRPHAPRPPTAVTARCHGIFDFRTRSHGPGLEAQ